MATSLKGAVAIIHFPFSDLSAVKKRPALIVADWGGNDVLLAQITSVAHKDNYALALYESDFTSGSLKNNPSFIRPNKLFTADKSTLLQTIGFISDNKTAEVIRAVEDILHSQ